MNIDEFVKARIHESINIRRGLVCLAALDPVMGSEISKTRPVVIISNDKNNEYSGTVTVLPITSKNLKNLFKIPHLYFDKNTDLWFEFCDLDLFNYFVVFCIAGQQGNAMGHSCCTN